MEITQINACLFEGRTEMSFTVTTDLPVAEAISSVLALFPTPATEVTGVVVTDQLGLVTRGQVQADAQAEANIIDEPAETAKTEKVTRTRRPRTNPDAVHVNTFLAEANARAAEAPAADAPADAPAAAVRRRRGSDTPAEPEVKVITDADLAKAASNAAAIIGHEVVTAVLDEVFSVKMVGEIPADKREAFLKELDDEIELAKADLAKMQGSK